MPWMRLERASRAGDVEEDDVDDLARTNWHRVRRVVVSVVGEGGIVVDVQSALVSLDEVRHCRHVFGVLSSYIST